MVSEWVSDRLEFKPGAYATRAALLRDYMAWCREQDRQALSTQVLYKAIRARGCVEIRKCGEPGFMGVRIRG